MADCVKTGNKIFCANTGYYGEILKETDNGYVIKYWHNPKSGIGYENHIIPKVRVQES